MNSLDIFQEAKRLPLDSKNTTAPEIASHAIIPTSPDSQSQVVHQAMYLCPPNGQEGLRTGCWLKTSLEI